MRETVNRSTPSDWPELPWTEWSDTAATLHLFTQVVGKIRLSRMPWINHSWHVPLYPSARGLTTGPVAVGGRIAELGFDLIEHVLKIETADGRTGQVPLRGRSVADFYGAVMEQLQSLDVATRIHTTPSEIADATPFEQDHEHHHYDPEFANRFHRALLQVHRVFMEFRAGYIGKVSPVHFFWGSFDLAVTRFSGRQAPPHPGGVPNFPDWVAREAYSHEVSSAGFWPGGGGIDYPAFYAYAYPAADGYATAAIRPEAAFYAAELGEFLLPYDAVRNAASPDDVLLDFLESSYDAAAELAGWDRALLERPADGFGPG